MVLYNASFFLDHHLLETTLNHVVKYRLYLATSFCCSWWCQTHSEANVHFSLASSALLLNSQKISLLREMWFFFFFSCQKWPESLISVAFLAWAQYTNSSHNMCIVQWRIQLKCMYDYSVKLNMKCMLLRKNCFSVFCY